MAKRAGYSVGTPEEATAILRLCLAPGCGFRRVNGRLFVNTRYGSAGLSLRADGTWPQAELGRLGFGGTQAQSIAQLVRWLRGESRRPLRCWESAWGKEVAAALSATSYPEPAAMACVLCGSPDATDWWYIAGDPRHGPCCSFATCADPERVARREEADRRRREELRAAARTLKPYLRHLNDCETQQPLTGRVWPHKPTCTCGLAELMGDTDA